MGWVLAVMVLSGRAGASEHHEVATAFEPVPASVEIGGVVHHGVLFDEAGALDVVRIRAEVRALTIERDALRVRLQEQVAITDEVADAIRAEAVRAREEAGAACVRAVESASRRTWIERHGLPLGAGLGAGAVLASAIAISAL